MPNFNKYNTRLLKLIATTGNRIRLIFENGVDSITFVSQYVTIRPGLFSLDKYPLLKQKVEETMSQMHGAITVTLTEAIQESWGLSVEKNDTLVTERLAGAIPTSEAGAVLYNPNYNARDAFIARKERGLGLSGRVWNLLEPFPHEIEQGLYVGINEGKPAVQIARDIKKYLKEPDRLYKKVRDSSGELRLSKAAMEYRPGQGVYRNSMANAMRLTRSEVNGAHRISDQIRWRGLPFVTGTRIVLSNRHPRYDICNVLNQGIYPKEFVWHGWHSNCLCHQIPVMVTDDQYDRIEDFTLGLTDQKPHIEMTKEMPAAFNAYVSSNAERINGWKNRPYWVKHNPKFVKELLNQ